MNPLLLRLGIGVIATIVTCLAAYHTYRRQQALLQSTVSSFDGSSVTVCCICLEQLPVINENAMVSLPCKHKFHKKCIKAAFSAQSSVNSCPLCRRRIASSFVSNVLKNSDF